MPQSWFSMDRFSMEPSGDPCTQPFPHKTSHCTSAMLYAQIAFALVCTCLGLIHMIHKLLWELINDGQREGCKRTRKVGQIMLVLRPFDCPVHDGVRIQVSMSQSWKCAFNVCSLVRKKIEFIAGLLVRLLRELTWPLISGFMESMWVL